MRFVKQRNSVSCGPVVALNALKWAGERLTYKNTIPLLSDAFNCVKNGGTPVSSLIDFLRLHPTLVVSKRFRKVKVKIRDVDNWLDKGNAVVLGFWQYDNRERRWVGHVVLITYKFGGLGYLVHNMYTSSDLVRKRRVRYWLSGNDNRSPLNPDVIFIRRS